MAVDVVENYIVIIAGALSGCSSPKLHIKNGEWYLHEPAILRAAKSSPPPFETTTQMRCYISSLSHA